MAELRITHAFHLRVALALVGVCGAGLVLSGSLTTFSENLWLWIATAVAFIYIAARWAVGDAMKYIQVKEAEIETHKRRFETEKQRLSREIQQTQDERAQARAALRERAAGLPTLLAALETYYVVQDEGVAKALERKSRPAYKAAETVREETRLRRVAERAALTAKAMVDFYESIAPFLVDFKEEISEDEEDAAEWLRDYTEEEREDRTTQFLAKVEYRTLSPAERNELALRRYWDRTHSASAIGKMYERYVGYWYESQGYSVGTTAYSRGSRILAAI